MKNFIFVFLAFLALTAPGNQTIFTSPTTVTVTTSSTLALASNSLRTYLLIQNNGAVPVIVKFGSVQSASEGVSIPAGGNYEPLLGPANSVYMKTGSSTASVTMIQGQ